MNKTKIQIKSIWGSILFEHTSKDNTIKETVTKAVESRADLTRANLIRADLTGANLTGAYLTRANLTRANLTGADLKKIRAVNQIIPEEGVFTAWKKGYNNDGGCLIKLEIPAKAKRHNTLGGRKCRAEFVKVLDIRNSKGNKIKTCRPGHNSKFIYKIGEIVMPDKYDPDPLVECSNGIHFFISKQEAKDW